MASREGFLLDYLVAGLIGFLFGEFAFGFAGPGRDIIEFVGILVVAGIFFIIPGGIVASYLNFRFHAVGQNLEMEGLSAGFFTAFIYSIITLFQTIVYSVLNQNLAGRFFLEWFISVLFAFLFFMIGGYIGGALEKRPFAMPGIFNLSHILRSPPPPPTAAITACPTCGKPLTFVQQYNRWYCQNEKKYV